MITEASCENESRQTCWRLRSLPETIAGSDGSIVSGALRLLKVCFDAGEQIEQGGADVADNHDNGDADAGGNQAIFNGGDTGLVLEKTIELRHDSLLLASTRSAGCGLRAIRSRPR